MAFPAASGHACERRRSGADLYGGVVRRRFVHASRLANNPHIAQSRLLSTCGIRARDKSLPRSVGSSERHPSSIPPANTQDQRPDFINRSLADAWGRAALRQRTDDHARPGRSLSASQLTPSSSHRDGSPDLLNTGPLRRTSGSPRPLTSDRSSSPPVPSCRRDSRFPASGPEIVCLPLPKIVARAHGGVQPINVDEDGSWSCERKSSQVDPCAE